MCGTTDGPFEADHVVPLAAGGSNRMDNAQLLCVPCHKRKTAKDARVIAKIRRQSQKFGSESARNRKWKQALGSKKWKRKVNGKVVPRE